MKLVWNEYFTYEDGNLYWNKLLSRRNPVGKLAGSFASNGYRQVQIDGTNYRVHRIIYEMLVGEIERGCYIDHINGDKSDNRLENLRVATPAQNQANSKTPRNNTSGYKGVSYIKSRGKFQATIAVNGKSINLGSFDCPKEAYKVYIVAAEELHKEYSNCG
jgi:hypothetical protein